MHKIFATLVILFSLYGCGINVPECNSELAQNLLKHAYYDNYRLNQDVVTISFALTSTESINKDLGARSCKTQITVKYTDEVWQKIVDVRQKNTTFQFMYLWNTSGYKNTNFEKEKSVVVDYKIKTDEETKKHFITYNTYWLFETDLSYDYWQKWF